MYIVYVLVDAIASRTYVGQTQKLSERLTLHNAGRVRSTKGGGPWRVLYQEQVGSRSEALKRESYFKSGAGRRQIAKLLQERCPSG